MKAAPDILFLASYEKLSQLPRPDRPEYAFAGRSNVGKSSLLNCLARRKSLARTSGTPGKTITFNFYNVDGHWYLVDLPGYGYAKRSVTLRKKWEKNMRAYFLSRENLMCVFLLIDMRIPPQSSDTELMEWMATHHIPFVIIFTKSDKLKKADLKKNLERYKNFLDASWEELPQHIVTSSKKRLGCDEVLGFIEITNLKFEN